MSNYYEVLGLNIRLSGRPLDQTKLKQAYRQALLSHHPDKERHSGSKLQYLTVDDITSAYKTLSDEHKRAEYDRLLSQEPARNGEDQDGRVHHTGLETVDLDSLAFDDQSRTWSRCCRCGDAKGYIVTEAELEKHVEHGELMVGCKGCSLWLKVLFGVEDEG